MLTVEQMKALQVGDVVYTAWQDDISYDAVDHHGFKRRTKRAVVTKCCKKTRHVRFDDGGRRATFRLDDWCHLHLYTQDQVDAMRARADVVKAEEAAEQEAKRACAKLIEDAIATIYDALTPASVMAVPFYNVNREPSLQITVPPQHAAKVAAAIVAALKSEEA